MGVTRSVRHMSHADWTELIHSTALPAEFQPADNRVFERRLRRARDVQYLVNEYFGMGPLSWQDMSDGKAKYEAYLLSREWAAKVELIRERSGGDCERCEWAAHEHTHHLTYDRLYNEPLSDLLGVCSDCHDVLHRKSESDPRKVEEWLHEEKARFLKTVATDRSFRKRLMRLLLPTRTPSTPSSN